ncbi:hypothetical protein F4781DRAFT_431713 [Annulohypoxylon bovei var. microspora]|nr:hypothetical protein F4781DRAFT_431713 [Annulohypoxylon bovei var. microspora]
MDDDSESIAEYIDQESVDIMADPFTAGKRPMGDLPCDPREHFLITLKIRLNQARKEWLQVFLAIDEDIQQYRRDYWVKTLRVASHKKSRQKVGSDMDRNRSQSRDEHQEWMRQSFELLREFIGILNQYSEEWKRFSDTSGNYFASTDDSGHWDRLRKSLEAIDQEIIHLERLRNKFKYLLECCEEMSRVFNCRIALEDNESALFQQETARDVKVLTWITFVKQLNIQVLC